MDSGSDIQIIGVVLDQMADIALEEGVQADIAIERFSAGVDRLLGWLPADLQLEALELARAHGYCTPIEVNRLRQESHTHEPF